MKSTGKSRTAIGVDVGTRSIKAAQLSLSGGKPRIAALSMLPRSKEGDQIETEDLLRMKRLFKRQGFYGNEIVLTAPENGLLRGVFDVPPQVSGAPVAQIARMELSRIHHVVPDSFEMVRWDPPDPGKSKSTTQTLAIGCPHEAADAFIDVFEDCGFTVSALDIRIAAAARACKTLTVPPPALTSILDIGWDSTKLLLICGDTLIYERSFRNKCLAKLRGTLCQTFNITEEAADQVISAIGFEANGEAGELDQESVDVVRRMLRKHFDMMLEELEASFDYANYQYPGEGAKRLLLIGGGARISGLSNYFRNILGVEVRVAAPSDILESSSQKFTNAGHPAITVAVGLAMFTGD
ncbi:MAG: pilus assembly protein PilM [Candidatus Hydrogenedentota bacterium]|nr:MAG: pilus assembly protein PilM [Candidatus Hydrogenedentota bacterium]